jgi:hypothetical protein
MSLKTNYNIKNNTPGMYVFAMHACQAAMRIFPLLIEWHENPAQWRQGAHGS